MREGLQKIIPADDTIVAISTPFGRSGIGVVRISGPEARALAGRFLKAGTPLEHRRAVIGFWQDERGEPVDEVVATFFERPFSYTGEDVLEISAHGNPFILNKIVRLIQAAGGRVAAPGEFTLRALAHCKIDLIQAEAVRDFIDAQTDLQARTAMRQMEGAVSKAIGPVKDRLVGVIAHLEAAIDFADDDVEPPQVDAAAGHIVQIHDALEALHRTYSYGKLLTAGLRLAIVGKPNVGKSSLFNRLLSAERAIVTDVPGTTRDVLAETMTLDGIPIRFFDTAGLREATDQVEKIGVSRTIETLAEADLVLAVFDGSAAFGELDSQVLARVAGLPHVVVVNKCDLPQRMESAFTGATEVRLSAVTGEGVESLRGAIRSFLGGSGAQAVSESILTNARQDEAVIRAIQALQTASDSMGAGTPHEMVLLDLYETLAALNELTGEVVGEDILSRIFSTFCIGK